MIKLEHTEVTGWEATIRGMRNPMNSWDKSDSGIGYISKDDREDGSIRTFSDESPRNDFWIGPADQDLMMRLARAGSVDAKYRRMINVTVDITAPFYWWKEFDTYKVGTVANSCSTMHKIHAKEFTLDDFSYEHLDEEPIRVTWDNQYYEDTALDHLKDTIGLLNAYRDKFLETKDKKYWWQMIQLLPTSYNQKRTVQLNYEVLAGIYPKRKNHKLDEWHVFCDWIKALPYSKIITLEGIFYDVHWNEASQK